jgi:hypothetical protein
MSFLRPLVSLIGMFQRLFGMLLPGLVVFFPVVCGSSTVRMCGKFVKLCGSLVRVIWHRVFPQYRVHPRTIPFPNLSTCEHLRRGNL